MPNHNAFKRSNWAVSFLEVTKFDQAGDNVMVKADPIHLDAGTGTGDSGDFSPSSPFILCLEIITTGYINENAKVEGRAWLEFFCQSD